MRQIAVCTAIGSLLVLPISAAAQSRPAASGNAQPASSQAQLPDSPGQLLKGTVTGKVLDVNGGVVAEAQVTLIGLDGSPTHVAVSGPAGEFRFTGLNPGRYKLNVTATGLSPYLSPEFAVRAGEEIAVPQFKMPLAQASADVQVTITEEQLATEQVEAEEHQRAFGVLPNFYSSYIWKAAPLSARQKYGLALHSIADPFSFFGAAFIAGVQQQQKVYPGYGDDAAGYGKRFAAAYGDDAIARMIGSAVLPALLRQDPRYFYQGTGGKKSRAIHAIVSAVVCRGDNGRQQPNYSFVLGSFASGGLSNLYHPAAQRGVGLTIANGFLNVAGHAVDDLIREFVLRRVTPKVPDYAQGKQ